MDKTVLVSKAKLRQWLANLAEQKAKITELETEISSFLGLLADEATPIVTRVGQVLEPKMGTRAGKIVPPKATSGQTQRRLSLLFSPKELPIGELALFCSGQEIGGSKMVSSSVALSTGRLVLHHDFDQPYSHHRAELEAILFALRLLEHLGRGNTVEFPALIATASASAFSWINGQNSDFSQLESDLEATELIHKIRHLRAGFQNLSFTFWDEAKQGVIPSNPDFRK